MHVVVVSDFANPCGGAERVAIESAVALARLGVTVKFLAAVGPIDDQLRIPNITVHVLGANALKDKNPIDLVISGLWSTKAAAMAALVLKECPPDTVIHLHAWQRALTASTIRELGKSGFPVVLTVHEYGFACPNQGFFDYQKFEICKKKALSFDCMVTHCDTRTYVHKLWRSGRVLLQHQAAHLREIVTDAIYLSELSREVLEPYFSSHTRWHALRNPMRLQQWQRIDPSKNKNFIFVGRVSLEKGVDVFAEAAHQAGVSAIIVGDGPQLPELRSRFPDLTYLGWQDERGVAEALRNARAFVFPSRWYEGQPLVVQEALSMGLPVLVSDATAAREAVIDQETGLHFSNMNVSQLAQRLLQIKNSDSLVTKLSITAYERYWAQPQTQESYGRDLLSLMDSIAARCFGRKS